MQIVGIEYRAHLSQAVASDRCNLRLRASGNRQPRHGGAAKVIEGDANDSGFLTGFAP